MKNNKKTLIQTKKILVKCTYIVQDENRLVRVFKFDVENGLDDGDQ